MRRLALVASAAGPAGRERELDEVQRGSAACRAGVRRVSSAWPTSRSSRATYSGSGARPTRIRACSRWLQRGGRILATHDGALLLVRLGLERGTRRSAAAFPILAPPGSASPGSAPIRCLPACVTAPCSRRLRRRPADAVLLRTAGGRPMAARRRRRAAWTRARPRHRPRLGVRRRRRRSAVPGFHPRCWRRRPTHRREAEVVLANALVGDAIPHRERATPAVLWPPPGRRATGVESAEPLARRARGRVARHRPRPRSISRRRPNGPMPAAACWSARDRPAGRREVWAPPFRIMHDAADPRRDHLRARARGRGRDGGRARDRGSSAAGAMDRGGGRSGASCGRSAARPDSRSTRGVGRGPAPRLAVPGRVVRRPRFRRRGRRAELRRHVGGGAAGALRRDGRLASRSTGPTDAPVVRVAVRRA